MESTYTANRETRKGGRSLLRAESKERLQTPSRTPARPRTLAVVLAVLLAGLGLALAPAARAQLNWLNPEDGEILNVSSADGPEAGHPFLQVRRSIERSAPRGTVLINRLRFQYGVNNFASVGVSGIHLYQRFDGYEKKGLGDINISLKLYYHPDPHVPLRLGIRQSLSIPTGYELERNGLASFTSRQNDYTAQALLQYVNPRFSAYLNPGVVLPGGSGNTAATGGFGLAFTLPLGLDLRGEYYTHWDVVDRRSSSEIYGGARLPLLLGLSAQFGVKRKLLQGEQVDPEYQLGFCFGRDRTPDADAYEVPIRRGHTRLLIHGIESLVPDPHGVGQDLSDVFRTDRSGGEERLAIFVRNYPADRAEEMYKIRHYELNVRILEINEGEVGGLNLSPVLRWARSSTEIVAQGELIAPDGYSVVRRAVYRGLSSKSIGFDFIPDSGSLDATVTTDEVKADLRRSATRDLAAAILRDVVRVMNERDEP